MTREPTTTEAPTDVQNIAADAFCPRCGYNLRGLDARRCPECGDPFDAASLSVSRIPWTQRRRIGPFRAYWRTVRMVTFQPGRFCAEFGRRVDYADAQHFRWLTIVHAYVPLFLVSQFLMNYLFLPWRIEADLASARAVYFGSSAVLQVCLFLFLIALTGMPGWFFHPRGLSVKLQNRGVAMSNYACAPLAWMAAALPLAVLGLFEGALFGVWDGGPVALRVLVFGSIGAAGLVPFLGPLLTWLVLIRLSGRMAEQYDGSSVRVAVFLPIVWLLSASLILVALPLLAVFYIVVFHSFG